MSDQVRFMSYKSPKTVASESVYQFLHGALYGAAWGCVTPFPLPGPSPSPGSFQPVVPFGALRSVPSSALYFGSVLGFQRLCSKTVELVRRQEDIYNDLFGFTMLWPYYEYFLNHSERRLAYHNRFVGTLLVGSVAYATFLA